MNFNFEQIANHVKISQCRKYAYPIDSITGCSTFAPIEYFKKILQNKYGNDVIRFTKEYITRETKKYLDAGYTVEQIKDIASKSKKNKLPKINVKPKKHPNMPKKERRKRLASHAESTTVVINEEGKEEKVRTYPWTGNPDYFRSDGPAYTDLAEISKEACLRPDIHLNEKCDGCPHYDICLCPLKE